MKLNQISTNNITFLDDIDKSIKIDKTNKSYYFKIFILSTEGIYMFFNNLEHNGVYLVNPFISINDLNSDPYLTLSKHFLVTRLSNPYLISNYLNNQLVKAENDFGFDLIIENNNYFLILKYKLVKLDFNKGN